MATKKQAPSKADRVFQAMQQPLKRAVKSLVKEQRERNREADAQLASELAEGPEVPPYPGLDSLEAQA